MYAVSCSMALVCCSSVKHWASFSSNTHDTWSASAAELYAVPASTSGVSAVMLFRRAGEIVLGLLDPCDGGLGHERRGGARRRWGGGVRHARRCGDCLRERRLGVDEFLLRGGEIGLGGLDRVDRGGDLGLRLDEVGPQCLHVAHGGDRIREQMAIAIERVDVSRGRPTEVGVRGHQAVLRRADAVLGSRDAGRGGRHRIFGCRGRRCRAVVVVAARCHQQGHGDDRCGERDRSPPHRVLNTPRRHHRPPRQPSAPDGASARSSATCTL